MCDDARRPSVCSASSTGASTRRTGARASPFRQRARYADRHAGDAHRARSTVDGEGALSSGVRVCRSRARSATDDIARRGAILQMGHAVSRVGILGAARTTTRTRAGSASIRVTLASRQRQLDDARARDAGPRRRVAGDAPSRGTHCRRRRRRRDRASFVFSRRRRRTSDADDDSVDGGGVRACAPVVAGSRERRTTCARSSPPCSLALDSSTPRRSSRRAARRSSRTRGIAGSMTREADEYYRRALTRASALRRADARVHPRDARSLAAPNVERASRRHSIPPEPTRSSSGASGRHPVRHHRRILRHAHGTRRRRRAAHGDAVRPGRPESRSSSSTASSRMVCRVGRGMTRAVTAAGSVATRSCRCARSSSSTRSAVGERATRAVAIARRRASRPTARWTGDSPRRIRSVICPASRRVSGATDATRSSIRCAAPASPTPHSAARSFASRRKLIRESSIIAHEGRHAIDDAMLPPLGTGGARVSREAVGGRVRGASEDRSVVDHPPKHRRRDSTRPRERTRDARIDSLDARERVVDSRIGCR